MGSARLPQSAGYIAYVNAMVLGTALFLETWPYERFAWEFTSFPSLAEAGCVEEPLGCF